MKSLSWLRESLRELAVRNFIAPLLMTSLLLLTPTVAHADPGDEQLSQGQTYQQKQDFDNAITTLESYIRQYPTSTSLNKAYLYLGCSYLGRYTLQGNASTNDLASARACFKYILDQGRTDAQGRDVQSYRDAYFHNARSYYNEQNYTAARTLLTSFLNDFPKDATFEKYVLYYLGVCETNVGTLDKALSYYEESEQKYPDSPLKWFVKLEKAAIFGRKGDYAESDRQLAAIASDPSAPVNIVGQATIQRSLLMLVQNKASDAAQLLENYTQQYKNDPNAAATVQDAYLYEAYAFFAQKEYQRALNLIDRLEAQGGSLPPEAATVKIKLFLALGRIQEAETLLNQLAESDYGRLKPDIITSYGAMINAVKGNRDQVISSLQSMLQPKTTGTGQNVEFNYFNTIRNYLDPIDFVEACGVLTVAYAGRYAQTQDQTDNANQEALYQATARYVATLNDPAIELILTAIDRARKTAATNPTNSQQGFSVLTPGGMNAGQPFGGDGYTEPRPNYQGYQPQQNFQRQNPQFPNSQQQLPTNQNGQTGAPQQNYSALAPSNAPGLELPPGTASGTQNGALPQNNSFLPGGQTNATGQLGQPGAQQQYPTVGQNGQQPYTSGVQGAQTGQQGYYDPQTGQVPVTSQEMASTPLTPAEARQALDRAENLYKNLEFDRANEILLETMTKSESFWTDCPEEAARISLLRANALLKLDKRSEAQMTCEDLVSHEPGVPEAAVAYYYLGSMADSIGRTDEAIDNLRKATNRGDFPYADAALYYLGTNELERGDFNAAGQTFGKLCSRYRQSPYWSHGVWRLAQLEADRGNDAKAESLVNEALAGRPDSAIIDYLLFLKGEIALRAKDYDKALVAFDMIVNQYPDSVWYSRAKNRLTTIPARFLNAAESTAYAAPTAAESAGRTDVQEAPLTPRAAGQPQSGLGDAASRYPLDPRTGVAPQDDRESAVRIPSSSDLRSRAAQPGFGSASSGASTDTQSAARQPATDPVRGSATETPSGQRRTPISSSPSTSPSSSRSSSASGAGRSTSSSSRYN